MKNKGILFVSCLLYVWYTVGKLNIYDSQLVSSQGWLDRFVFLGLRRHGNRPHQANSQTQNILFSLPPLLHPSFFFDLSIYIYIYIYVRTGCFSRHCFAFYRRLSRDKVLPWWRKEIFGFLGEEKRERERLFDKAWWRDKDWVILQCWTFLHFNRLEFRPPLSLFEEKFCTVFLWDWKYNFWKIYLCSNSKKGKNCNTDSIILGYMHITSSPFKERIQRRREKD